NSRPYSLPGSGGISVGRDRIVRAMPTRRASPVTPRMPGRSALLAMSRALSTSLTQAVSTARHISQRPGSIEAGRFGVFKAGLPFTHYGTSGAAPAAGLSSHPPCCLTTRYTMPNPTLIQVPAGDGGDGVIARQPALLGRHGRHLCGFAVIADSHLEPEEPGAPAPRSNARNRRLVHDLARRRPAFALHLGDIVH